jgi:hypothetical protein
MSSELAMNAYVLLGNALNYFVNGLGAPLESGFDPAAIRTLYVHLEPLPPSQILDALAALPAEQKAVLAGVCRYLILQTAPGQTETILGLPAETIEQTLTDLGL